MVVYSELPPMMLTLGASGIESGCLYHARKPEQNTGNIATFYRDLH